MMCLMCSPAETRDIMLDIRAKIKDIMMKAKDLDNVSTQYVSLSSRLNCFVERPTV